MQAMRFLVQLKLLFYLLLPYIHMFDICLSVPYALLWWLRCSCLSLGFSYFGYANYGFNANLLNDSIQILSLLTNVI